MKKYLLTFGLIIASQSVYPNDLNAASTRQYAESTLLNTSRQSSSLVDLNLGKCPHLDWDNPCFPVGPTGATGATGATGPKGERGPQGERGKPGNHGAQGCQGEPGCSGQNGRRGPPGRNGLDGKRGPRGFPGPEGCRGPRGASGPTGATGPSIADAAQYSYVQFDLTQTPVSVPPLGYMQYNTLGFNSGVFVASPALPNADTFILPTGPNLYLINYGIAGAMGPATFVLEVNGSTNIPGSLLTANTDPAYDTLVSTSVIYETSLGVTYLRVKNNSTSSASIGSTHAFPFTASYISITKLN